MTATLPELRQAVIDSVRTIAPEADFEALDPRRPMREELDIDSFDFLNVLIELHGRTGVEIPEADYGKVGTLEALLAYLAQRLDLR
ncbi:MAG: acyl carrier protein [Burkholderiaceae bacterium]|nr:acyl carrier protein [Burkholderiaceae bacterium]